MVKQFTGAMADGQLAEEARAVKPVDTAALRSDLTTEIRKIFPGFIDASAALRAQTGSWLLRSYLSSNSCGGSKSSCLAGCSRTAAR